VEHEKRLHALEDVHVRDNVIDINIVIIIVVVVDDDI
jgi:hypothetical protein